MYPEVQCEGNVSPELIVPYFEPGFNISFIKLRLNDQRSNSLDITKKSKGKDI